MNFWLNKADRLERLRVQQDGLKDISKRLSDMAFRASGVGREERRLLAESDKYFEAWKKIEATIAALEGKKG